MSQGGYIEYIVDYCSPVERDAQYYARHCIAGMHFTEPGVVVGEKLDACDRHRSSATPLDTRDLEV